MMEKKVLIAAKDIPMRMPVISSLVWWLFLHEIEAPGWAYGAVGVVLGISWIAWAVQIFMFEHKSVFDR
jgi:heme O synthase-like polyprenyltransferase